MGKKQQQRQRRIEKLECELKELKAFTAEDLAREQLADDLEEAFQEALPDTFWSVTYSSEPPSLRNWIHPTPEEVAWEGACFIVDGELEGMFENRGRTTLTMRYFLMGTPDLLDRRNELQPFVEEIIESYPEHLEEAGYTGPREYGRIPA